MRCIIHCPGGHKGGGAVAVLLALIVFVGVMIFAQELQTLVVIAMITVYGLSALGIAWIANMWRKEYVEMRGSIRGALTQGTGASQSIPAQITAINGLQLASPESLEDTLVLPAIERGGAQLRDEGFLSPAQLDRLMVRYHEGRGARNGNGKRPGWKQN
jgi:hypothetical protein